MFSPKSTALIIETLTEAASDAEQAYNDAKSILEQIMEALPSARSRAGELRAAHVKASARVAATKAKARDLRWALAEFRAKAT